MIGTFRGGTLVCALLTGPACGDDTSGSGDPGDGATSTGDDVATTLPVTISASTDPSTSATATPTDPTLTGSTGGSSGEASTGSSGSDTTGPGPTGSSSTSGGEGFVVEWCILQFPAEIIETAGVATPVYARVYVEGITDGTEFVDAHPSLLAEFGYGADDSDPTVDAWTWVDGAPNPGWDGTMAKGGFGNENNDEYLVDLSFPEPGTYDYAARFSADGGATWAYCDLDDLVTDGYTPDQAGHAEIG